MHYLQYSYEIVLIIVMIFRRKLSKLDFDLHSA